MQARDEGDKPFEQRYDKDHVLFSSIASCAKASLEAGNDILNYVTEVQNMVQDRVGDYSTVKALKYNER